MKILTAARDVLYSGRMYKRGERLPAYDDGMVTAWLAADSAKWSEDAAGQKTAPTAYADAAVLETWEMDKLKALAEKLEIDISKAKGKKQIVAMLSSAPQIAGGAHK